MFVLISKTNMSSNLLVGSKLISLIMKFHYRQNSKYLPSIKIMTQNYLVSDHDYYYVYLDKLIMHGG